MIERCPSCGSPVPEELQVCPSCGWDFVARKRVAKPSAGAPPPAAPAQPEAPKSEAPKAEPPRPEPRKPELPKPEFAKPEPAKPMSPPPASPPPAFGGFALPPARNLNEGAPSSSGLKPLPKLEPGPTDTPAEGENPFTLPAAGPKTPPAEERKPPVPERQEPELPAKEAPGEKEGFGSRLMRSLRRDAPATDAPAEKDALPASPAEPAGEPPPRARTPEPAARRAPPPPPREEPGLDLDLDLDAPPAAAPVAKAPPASAPPARKPKPADVPAEPVPEAAPEPILDEPEAPALEPAKARVPARSATAPAAAATPAPQASRNSPVYIAAVAGAALGTVSVLAVYLLLRPDTTTGVHPPRGDSPFSRERSTLPVLPAPTAPAAAPPAAAVPAQSPAPLIEAPAPVKAPAAVNAGGPIATPPPPPPQAVPPVKAPRAPAAPEDEERPAASFATVPRVVVGGQLPALKPKPKAVPEAADAPFAPAPKRARPAAEARPRKPKGPAWNFEGVVFDLLTARGVFAAKLAFLDADGNVAGETETGPGGRYKVALPPGDAKGYVLKIVHADYTDRYIDEGDATSSLREATPEERKILMQAAARNLPWVGNTGKTLHRDLALVPRSSEEP